MRLTGKIALVTGASQGIGEAIARRFAAEGAVALCAARSADKLSTLVASIEAAGGKARAVALDVADPASIAAAMKGIADGEGRLDVLVNNAGITEDNLILRMTKDSWDRVIATNLTGAFLLSQAAIKMMIRQRSGRILSITSVVGLMGNAGQANYAAAKAALVGLTKSLAREVGSRQVTVNAIAPGFIATSMTEKMTDAAKEGLASQIPLQRLGSPEDIAAAAVYLASDEAGYVTGTVLNVSGGLYM
ncbi:MAG TPA: 3-oxoacyl-[acyl-carrier-protein] reductase [Thermoanaerobaculia bacterium]|nr:3-oxoacyl-[acyl-carrier-protein] reductase [Thermoanaerobaculia bacterium]